MTPKEQAAMQQALEALEMYRPLSLPIKLLSQDKTREEAITALREALAEQEANEWYEKLLWDRRDGIGPATDYPETYDQIDEALRLAEESLLNWEMYANRTSALLWDESDDKALSSIRSVRKNKQAEQEHFMCEPVPPISEEGWTDWVCPKPKGYLMQCCDCGLIHEVDSRVAKYDPMPSEEFTVVEDQNMQCQWRVRRRDDLATTQPVKQEPVGYWQGKFSQDGGAVLYEVPQASAFGYHYPNYPLYAAPVRTKDLTDEEIDRALDAANVPELPAGYESIELEIARAVIAADREKNK